MIRILLADDHDVVRRGLRGLLEGQAGWAVCAEARTGRAAVMRKLGLGSLAELVRYAVRNQIIDP